MIMMEKNVFLFLQVDSHNNCAMLLMLINFMNQVHNANEIPVNSILSSEIETHYKIDGYCENWIPQYLNYDFFQLFRMSRDTFLALLHKINCPELEKIYTGGGIPVPPEKQLLITLWWLWKGEVLLSVADKFNVSVSTVFNCTERILKKLITLKNTYIVWPNSHELIDIEEDFRRKSGYPGVIGAIDGCNIHFKAPEEQQHSYIDKNSNHSIKLQGIVTSKKLFTNIMVGFPGSAHDCRMFRNSNLYVDITSHRKLHKYFPLDRYHLLGDKAYPLMNWLIKPYLNNGNLTRRQQNHNLAHSKTRIVIEHTFGLLKCRWRILKYINVNSVIKAIQIIAACCVLHNFCLTNSDIWEENVQDENIYDEDENGGIENNAGVIKRDQITRLL